MNKDDYLKRFGCKINAFYTQMRDYNKKDQALNQAIEAFMEAGLCLQAVTRSELEQVIAREHLAVFGMDRSERTRQEQVRATESGDYDGFDSPTWLRLGIPPFTHSGKKS